MVRFDSKLFLKQEYNQKNQSDFNAMFTIKYLHEAGAKIVLVSDWKTNTSELHTESVAGKDFLAILVFICHLKFGYYMKLQS